MIILQILRVNGDTKFGLHNAQLGNPPHLVDEQVTDSAVSPLPHQ